MKICLSLKRCQRKFFDIFLFLLRHNKVNLTTLTYIFYKSTAPANNNSAAFGTFFKKSAFCDTQVCLFCGLQQHLHPPLPILHYWSKLLHIDSLFNQLIAQSKVEQFLFNFLSTATYLMWLYFFCKS